MKNEIVILDYDVGNVFSISNSLNKIGKKNIITRDKKKIFESSHIILPGVGSFHTVINMLKKFKLNEILVKKFQKQDSYLLGICLGMQLLFSESNEGGMMNSGLNLIPGRVGKLKINQNFKLPNIGWRKIYRIDKKSKLVKGINENDYFYFVHSYGITDIKNTYLSGVSKYSENNFLAMVEYKNIFGCQFHPEKSGDKGLIILNNFCNL